MQVNRGLFVWLKSVKFQEKTTDNYMTADILRRYILMTALSKTANILTQKVAVPRIKGTPYALAPQMLHDPRIADRIRAVSPTFTPPDIRLAAGDIDIHAKPQEQLQALLRGETDMTTIGDLLWASRGQQGAETALKDIISANMAANGVKTLGLNGLGWTGNPFSVYWEKPEGKTTTPVEFQYLSKTTAYIDYSGTSYKPFIMGTTQLSRQLLSMGGFREVKDKLNSDLSGIFNRSQYEENNGVVTVDWLNAQRVKELLSWATGLPLEFMPYYRDCSIIDCNSYTGYPQMQAIFKALGEGIPKDVPVFWLGRSGFNYSEHAQIAVDPSQGSSQSLSDSGFKGRAAILLTIADPE